MSRIGEELQSTSKYRIFSNVSRLFIPLFSPNRMGDVSVVKGDGELSTKLDIHLFLTIVVNN